MFRGVRTTLIILFVILFTTTVVGDKKAVNYFPSTIDSYWVYEDQDGNEIKRTVIEGEEIAGEIYHAFSYQPEVEKVENFEYHIHPSLFTIDEQGIKFLMSDKVAKSYQKRLKSELQASMDEETRNIPAEIDIRPEFEFDVLVDAQDYFLMLPNAVQENEKWESIRIKPTVNIKIDYLKNDQEVDPELAGQAAYSSMYFTIIETGKVMGTETVETPSGSFDGCLKIEYRTKTVLPSSRMMGMPTVGEAVTTMWFAPNVGIVKYRKQAELPMLQHFENAETTTQVKTLELKKYEIKTEKVKAE